MFICWLLMNILMVITEHLLVINEVDNNELFNVYLQQDYSNNNKRYICQPSPR